MRNPIGKKLRVYASDGKLVGMFLSTGDPMQDVAIGHDLFLKAGYVTPSQTKAQRVRRQARNFARVSFDIYEIIKDLGQKCADYLAPFAVNAALGIELYLKAIGLLSGIERRGHKLVQLYDALPIEATQAIQLVAPEFVARHELECQPDIREYLVTLNDAFINWRYSYENQVGLITPRQALFLLHVLDKAFLKLQESSSNFTRSQGSHDRSR